MHIPSFDRTPARALLRTMSRYKDVVQVLVPGPRASSSLPSHVVKPSASSSALKTHEKDKPMNIDTLSRLQNLTASRVGHNKAAKKSVHEKCRQGLSYVERATDKVEDVKLQLIQAEKGLREAKEGQALLEATEENHNHTTQRYHDFQKDLGQLVRMRDEQVKGIRALNVASSKEILAASMCPMIRGVIDKYPDIAGDDVFIKTEDSP
jgi:hypothetical protein